MKTKVLHAPPFMGHLEAISKLGKWVEVKPPARRAYAPEGTVQRSEESRPQVGILLMKKLLGFFK